MKFTFTAIKTLIVFTIFLPHFIHAQNNSIVKKKFSLDLANTKALLNSSPEISEIGYDLSKSTMTLNLPINVTETRGFKLAKQSMINGKDNILHTFSGISSDSKANIKVAYKEEYFVAVVFENYQFKVYKSLPNQANTVELEEVNSGAFSCGTLSINEDFKNQAAKTNSTLISHAGIKKTYDIAIMITPEYYQNAGNSNSAVEANVLSNIMGLNLFYEKEVSISFNLITHAASGLKFFHNTSEASSNYTSNPSGINTRISNAFGSANYDIGHCFHYIPGGGSGVALLNVTCGGSKAGGYSSSSSVSGSYFYNIFFHEVGHQFNAPHTFSGSGSNCSGGNYNSSTAYEPGSGSTLMSYAGICSPQNIQAGGDFYFHYNSLNRIITKKNGDTCPTSTTFSNTAPTVNAGADFTVPKNTPFYINGSATDAEGNPMSYTFEQYNLTTNQGALGSIAGSSGTNAYNDPNAPLFRSYPPNGEDSRSFPNLVYVLNAANIAPDLSAEAMSNVSRTINVKMVVRDNNPSGNGVNSDDIAVTVDGTKGPLTVTAPNGGETFTAGSSTTISWDVNSTNSIMANVQIEISIDGGFTYPYLLATTANDGSHTLVFPADIPASTIARLRVRSYEIPGGGNPTAKIMAIGTSAFFYDVSNANFTISNGSCTVQNSHLCSDASLSAAAGSSSLNLSITPTFYSAQNSINQSTSGSNMSVFFKTNAGTCSNFSSDATVTKIFRVSVSGRYAFSLIRGINISVHSGTSPSCANFLGASSTDIGGGYYSDESSVVLDLNSCTDYTYRANSFEADNLIRLIIQGPGDIMLAETQNTSSSVYAYVAVSDEDGLIKQYGTSPNYSSLNGGNYKIYGVHHANSFSSSTFLNNSINTIISGTSCATFSTNFKPITITCASFPAATISPSGSVSICTGSTQIFSANTGTGLSYVWRLNNTAISGATNASYTASSAGTYTVVVSLNGCSTTSSAVNLSVNAAPSVSVSPVSVNYGSDASLSASGCTGTLGWFLGVSSLGGGNPLLIQQALSSQTYTARCTSAEGCVTNTNVLLTVICPQTLTLNSPSSDINSGNKLYGTSNNSASSNPGSISASNKISGGTVRYSAGKSISLNPGFQANTGTVFTGIIGGCVN
jgi:hypothetical protein